MEITSGCLTWHMARRHLLVFPGCAYRPISRPMFSWVPPLDTRSAASQCSGSRRFSVVLGIALLAGVPGALLAQLNTGLLEGSLRAADGHRVAAALVVITGGAGFRATLRTNSIGEFSATLPYGRYQLSAENQRDAFTVFVAPLQT